MTCAILVDLADRRGTLATLTWNRRVMMDRPTGVVAVVIVMVGTSPTTTAAAASSTRRTTTSRRQWPGAQLVGAGTTAAASATQQCGAASVRRLRFQGLAMQILVLTAAHPGTSGAAAMTLGLCPAVAPTCHRHTRHHLPSMAAAAAADLITAPGRHRRRQ